MILKETKKKIRELEARRDGVEAVEKDSEVSEDAEEGYFDASSDKIDDKLIYGDPVNP